MVQRGLTFGGKVALVAFLLVTTIVIGIIDPTPYHLITGFYVSMGLFFGFRFLNLG